MLRWCGAVIVVYIVQVQGTEPSLLYNLSKIAEDVPHCVASTTEYDAQISHIRIPPIVLLPLLPSSVQEFAWELFPYALFLSNNPKDKHLGI